VQRARTRHGDLRTDFRIRLEERNVAGIDRMGPLHAACDPRQRLRAAAAALLLTLLGADRVGATDRIDADIAELTIEEAVIGAAAEFAVGDKFEAEVFLQPDGAADRLVFRRGQRGLIDLATREPGALLHQIRGPQQTAYMLRAKRRLGGDHFGADVHGVTLPSLVPAASLIPAPPVCPQG
jgi:hypothetical protein